MSHKNKPLTVPLKDQVEKKPFVLSPFNESKYNVWKTANYHKDEVGYFTDIVVNFRVYYTEEDLMTEYTKQKTWCEDPNDEDGYKNFTFGFKADLYF